MGLEVVSHFPVIAILTSEHEHVNENRRMQRLRNKVNVLVIMN